MKLLSNYPLKKLTTMAIGGPAKFFIEVKDEDGLIESIRLAKKMKIPWYVISEGSNIIVSDDGYKGLIIKINISYLELDKNLVKVGAGNNLLNFIFSLNKQGLAGMEKMAGIPGSVGGAIFGNAGAYGQEISGYLRKVRVYDGKGIRWFSKKYCRFGYRESIFKKKKNWVVLGVEFKFKYGNKKELSKISRDIIKLREQKYLPRFKCPGSFFKNIVLSKISPKLKESILSKIDKSKLLSWKGKVPAGYLLEKVMAKNMKQGGVRVANHHGNLIINSGKGKAKDVKLLADILKKKVKKEFGIELEEEIQYVGLW